MTATAKPMFEIVCVNIATTRTGTVEHTHIVSVGVKEAAKEPAIISVKEAREMIQAGYLLYTVSPSTGKTALIEPLTCYCGVQTLRSNPDAEKDNNLDNLARCS